MNRTYNVFNAVGVLLHSGKTASELEELINIPSRRIFTICENGTLYKGYRIRMCTESDRPNGKESLSLYDAVKGTFIYFSVPRETITNQFGLSSQQLSNYILNHYMLRSKYFIFRMNEGKIMIPEWFSEWEKEAERIRNERKVKI